MAILGLSPPFSDTSTSYCLSICSCVLYFIYLYLWLYMHITPWPYPIKYPTITVDIDQISNITVFTGCHRFHWTSPCALPGGCTEDEHGQTAEGNRARKDLGSLANFFVIQQAHSPLHEPWWDSSFSWLPLFFSRPSSRLELVNCYLIGDLILDDPGS